MQISFHFGMKIHQILIKIRSQNDVEFRRGFGIDKKSIFFGSGTVPGPERRKKNQSKIYHKTEKKQ